MKDVASKINNILQNYKEGNKKSAYSKLKKISKAYPANEKLRFNQQNCTLKYHYLKRHCKESQVYNRLNTL